ncbi:hypothetical protein DFA_03141 [Cavenderia fasciculata]|uniref:Uncharacterized protein n=1 Tax=Cavenderia fasciculata TaxID=261658 RepID=F4PGR2_CACFS|nr:uncharacterized protein DFA_03141 [Cavenderia fasciculata]EGG24896.1 hypothetical protein DFA_03141 [Cavenderia fasciculata]|eukprot:XP_004362747.1 hypothetical protein DFA_03141 [Cavenderia fasciculata]
MVQGFQSSLVIGSGKRFMCTVNTPTTVGTKEFKIKTFSFGQLGVNQHVTFQPAKFDEHTSSIVVGHAVESKPFEAPTLLRTSYSHTLADKTVQEIIKLRPTMSQKQLADKFQTTKQVIARVCRAPEDQLQKRIDTFQVKKTRVVEPADVKKQRYDSWVDKMKQREYDNKVISKAKGHEDQIYFRASKHELAFLANQDTYDAMVSGYDLVRPDQKEDTEKKDKKPVVKQVGRKRRHVTEKEKLKVNKAKSAKMRLLGRMEDA